MATLKNHTGYWLRDDAAAAFDAAEAAIGTMRVNSAGRTEAEQNALIRRWDQGGPSNRPPYLYAPARPANTSFHVKNGGIAVDTSDWRRFAQVCEQFGFVHPYPSGDPVHFEYRGTPAKAISNLVSSRQRYLKYDMGETELVADGIAGPRYKAAVARYQGVLKKAGLYKGDLDGIWGNATETAHVAYKGRSSASTNSNPFGIARVSGLQKIGRLYGYKGKIDNIWGSGSAYGFAQFLRTNYGYVGNDVLGPVMWRAIAKWLRAKWGYVGNDVPGSVMRASLKRAEEANYKEL